MRKMHCNASWCSSIPVLFKFIAVSVWLLPFCSLLECAAHSPQTDISGSANVQVDVSSIDCAVRTLAVQYAEGLSATLTQPVFDALQLATLCNATRPNSNSLPFNTMRRIAHQNLVIPLIDSEDNERFSLTHNAFKEASSDTGSSKSSGSSPGNIPALERNAAIARAQWRVSMGKYIENDSYIYFVDSANGSDSNAGTEAAPFASVFHALQVLRYVRTSASTDFSFIFLRSGIHFLQHTIELSSIDSWLIIAGYDSEAPVVSGGILLQNLNWKALGNGVYSTPIAENVNVADDIFNILYVNGRRAIRARFPNANPEISGLYTTPTGWIDSAVSWKSRTMGKDLIEIHVQTPERSGTTFPNFLMGINGPADIFNPPQNFWALNSPPYGSQFQTPGGLVYDPNKFSPHASQWKQPEKGVINAFHGGYWGQWAFSQLTHDPSAHSIDWQLGGWQEARGDSYGGSWYVENIYEELDSEFEFYLDSESRTLYYYPNATFPLSAQFIAPQMETLFSIRGSIAQPVSSVAFHNLVFMHTSSTFLKPYEAPSGGDLSMYRGGAILLEGTESVEIAYSLFNGVSGNAICISNYNRNTTVRDSEFVWIGDSAIVTLGSSRLMDGHSSPTYPKYTNIINNYIHEIGIFTKQVSGVLSSLTSFLNVIGNVMFNMPRAAICINDGFGGGHLIEHNLLFNTVRETGDHGPFNSWDRQPYIFETDDGSAPTITPATMQIHNNFFINTYNSVWTIDHDDGSSYYYDSDNVLVYGGFKSYLGHSLTAANNLYILPDARGGTGGDPRWGRFCMQQCSPTAGQSGWDNYWKGNTCLLAYSGAVYDQQNCDVNNLKNVQPWTSDNTFYSPAPVEITCGNNNYTLVQWQQSTGYDSGSVEKGEPTVSVVVQLVKSWLAMQ